jgi:hypothetical protein
MLLGGGGGQQHRLVTDQNTPRGAAWRRQGPCCDEGGTPTPSSMKWQAGVAKLVGLFIQPLFQTHPGLPVPFIQVFQVNRQNVGTCTTT